MEKYEDIIRGLPYGSSFLFVDRIHFADDRHIEGSFFLRPDLDCYKGHFETYKITPGVILTEIMAQIGLVCMGIKLVGGSTEAFPFALTATRIDFYKPVYPSENVTVKSEKEYFRFGKLKCRVKLYNGTGEIVCEGILEGIQIKQRPWADEQ